MTEESKDTLEPEFPKSKSRVKRDMLELQRIGERLVTLNDHQLKKMAMPHDLFQAIQAAKKIHSHGAKRRQLQYIGKLMRQVENISPIIDFLLQLDNKDQKVIALNHMLEAWRERLVGGDSEVLTAYIQAHPEVDRQYLRQLIASAKKERVQGNPAGAGKLLFRYLKETETNSGDQ